jgi:hypothetical protein
MAGTVGIGTLTMKSPDIFRGESNHNGKLQIIHTNSITGSYSSLQPGDNLVTAGYPEGVPFGAGLFYDITAKATAPDAVTGGINGSTYANFLIAGILKYDQALQSSQPLPGDVCTDYNKGILVRQGVVNYSYWYGDLGDPRNETTWERYDGIHYGDKLAIDIKTGLPQFIAAGTAASADQIVVGAVIELYREAREWAVYVDIPSVLLSTVTA